MDDLDIGEEESFLLPIVVENLLSLFFKSYLYFYLNNSLDSNI